MMVTSLIEFPQLGVGAQSEFTVVAGNENFHFQNTVVGRI